MNFFLRTSLDCDTTFNVPADCSLQEKYDEIATDYDLRGFVPTIELDAGAAYSKLVMTNPLVGGCHINIIGNGSSITDTTGIQNNVPGINLSIKGMTLTAWGGGPNLAANMGGVITTLEGMEYGHSDVDHILATYGGKIFINANYKVNDGAGAHWHVYSDGYITAQNLTVDITPGLWFGNRWAGVADASLIARNMVYTNRDTIHCVQYLVHKGGFMEIGTCQLPGNVAGTLVAGSVIA